MSVFRIEKNDNYTVMSNYHLRDKSLSLKAKGLLSFMLSLPDNWDYSLNGLVKVLKEEETAIKTALDELKENNYLKVDKLLPNQTKSKKIEYVYNIYEQPIENQGVENLGVEVQGVENHTQINTNNKILNNNTFNDELYEHFQKIWEVYPVKKGKQKAETYFFAWIKGRKINGRNLKLTDKEMWYAVDTYLKEIKEKNIDLNYISHGDTFFNNKIYDYYEIWREQNDNS